MAPGKQPLSIETILEQQRKEKELQAKVRLAAPSTASMQPLTGL